MNELSGLLIFLDLAGTFVFAVTGAMVAARTKHDIITFLFFAIITGVGGGSIRDVLMGNQAFWIGAPEYIIACAIAAVLVWLFGKRIMQLSSIDWLDAIGLAAFAVVGAGKAISLGASPFSAIILGVITSTLGGVLRDVLANQQNMLLKREIYISAALLGSAGFVGLYKLGIDFWGAAIIGACLAFILRAGAIKYGWQLRGFGKSN